jgi:hypothetical protein
MLYIHQSTCISPQQTFLEVDLDTLHEPVDNKLKVIEPTYEGIPPGILRRMAKAVRIGVGAALPIIKDFSRIDGFIIGTSNAGMEDCIKFLNQIIQYEEGVLTPGNFVQSTPNALAGQLGLLAKNKNYNITHVHRGLSFEMAALDAMMMVEDYPENNYLLSAVDETSAYNYNIDRLSGWYKNDIITCENFYQKNTPGTISGESAITFLTNGNKDGAAAVIRDIHTLHTEDEFLIEKQLQRFLKNNLPEGEKIDLLISGENGDNRLVKYYIIAESIVSQNAAVARFKHMSGEYATASAFGVWFACRILQTQYMPAHSLKKKAQGSIKNILLYNNYKGSQHSFILLSKV